MADDAFDLNDPGMLELARRLEAYADARLSPSIAGTTRMRTSVMNAAHRRAARGAGRRHVRCRRRDHGDPCRRSARCRARAPGADRSSRSWPAPWPSRCWPARSPRRKPGGPLYAARLWIEMANLPAEVVARAQAEINRLDARLQEAQQASSAGDGPAAKAALAAYSVIVVEAARGSAGDPTASAAIEVTVTRHVVVLTLMVDSVPAPARDAVKDALSSSTKVLERSRWRRAKRGQSRWLDRCRPVEGDEAGGGQAREPEPCRRACGPRRDAATDEETVGPDRTPHLTRPTRAASPWTHAADGQGAGKGAGATGGAGYEDRAETTQARSSRPELPAEPLHPTPERPDRRCTLT